MDFTNLHPYTPMTAVLSWDHDLVGFYSQIYFISQNEIRLWFWEVSRMQLRHIAPRYPNTILSISCEGVVLQHLVQLSLNLYHVEYINHAVPSHYNKSYLTLRGRRGSYQLVVFQLFWVNAIGVPDASVHLSYSYTLGPKTVQVAHGVKAHVTKALKHERSSQDNSLVW